MLKFEPDGSLASSLAYVYFHSATQYHTFIEKNCEYWDARPGAATIPIDEVLQAPTKEDRAAVWKHFEARMDAYQKVTEATRSEDWFMTKRRDELYDDIIRAAFKAAEDTWAATGYHVSEMVPILNDLAVEIDRLFTEFGQIDWRDRFSYYPYRKR